MVCWFYSNMANNTMNDQNYKTLYYQGM